MTALAAGGTTRVGSLDLELAIEVAAGEVVGLVGPNGAGKSATFATLVGAVALGHGRIEVAGRVVDDGRLALPPHRRGLGWCPQEPALLPRRRLERQVATFASSTAPLGRDLAGLLHRLGLSQVAGTRPDRLSGGQRQRVAVARALAASAVVLLDEPFSAQDATGADAIRHAIRDHAAAGGSAVVVAHRPEDAYALADRLVVLERGAVVQTGTPGALAADPRTPYVARVVGATVLEGMIGDDLVLRGPWGQLRVPDATPPGAAVAVVRPAAVLLYPDPPADSSSRNVLAMTVAELTQRPEGVLVRLRGEPDLVAGITRAAAEALDLRPGAEVWASVKASEIDVRPLA